MVQTVVEFYIAIAYAFDLYSCMDPCAVRFDHRQIRQHIATCLENCQVCCVSETYQKQKRIINVLLASRRMDVNIIKRLFDSFRAVSRATTLMLYSYYH